MKKKTLAGCICAGIVVVVAITYAAIPQPSVDLLIYNKEHWMDKLSPEQLQVMIDRGSTTQTEYDARYRRGDIVEVRPGGYWTDGGRGFNRKAFCVVRVRNVSLNDASDYHKPLYSAVDPNIMLRKRKYNIDVTKLLLVDDKQTINNLTSVGFTDKSK